MKSKTPLGSVEERQFYNRAMVNLVCEMEDGSSDLFGIFLKLTMTFTTTVFCP